MDNTGNINSTYKQLMHIAYIAPNHLEITNLHFRNILILEFEL